MSKQKQNTQDSSTVADALSALLILPKTFSVFQPVFK